MRALLRSITAAFAAFAGSITRPDLPEIDDRTTLFFESGGRSRNVKNRASGERAHRDWRKRRSAGKA